MMWLSLTVMVELYLALCVLCLEYHSEAIANIVEPEQMQLLHSGLARSMEKTNHRGWQYDLMTELPSTFQVIIPSMEVRNPTAGYSDKNATSDVVTQASWLSNSVKLDTYPESPYLAYRIEVNDTNLECKFEFIGSRQYQMAIYFLLGLIPLISGLSSVWVYLHFCNGKKMKNLSSTKESILPFTNALPSSPSTQCIETNPYMMRVSPISSKMHRKRSAGPLKSANMTCYWAAMTAITEPQINYCDIGPEFCGLKAMFEAMSKILGQNIIWTVPCVGILDHGNDRLANTITFTALATHSTVQAQYQQFRSVIHVLLETSRFRAQTQAEVFPRQMNYIVNQALLDFWMPQHASIENVESKHHSRSGTPASQTPLNLDNSTHSRYGYSISFSETSNSITLAFTSDLMGPVPSYPTSIHLRSFISPESLSHQKNHPYLYNGMPRFTKNVSFLSMLERDILDSYGLLSAGSFCIRRHVVEMGKSWDHPDSKLEIKMATDLLIGLSTTPENANVLRYPNKAQFSMYENALGKLPVKDSERHHKRRLRKLLLCQIGKWPLYSLLLAFVSGSPSQLENRPNVLQGANNCSQFISDQPCHRRDWSI